MTYPWCSSIITCTGGAPSLSISGSALNRPEIVPIFWGSSWSTATTPSHGQVVGAVQYLLNGPYFAGLSQYDSVNGVGQARMVPMAPIDTSAIPSNVTATQVVAEINKLIGTGVVPIPASGSQVVYTVMLPPGTTNVLGGPGVNFPALCDSTCGSGWAGLPYRVIVEAPPSGANVQNYAWLFAHELAECITENVVVTNCTYNAGGAANQVSDLCGCNSEWQLGGEFQVQGYWSQANGACVIPEGWNVYQYTGGTSWTLIGGPVRQVYAGGYGLIATNTSDDVIQYTGTPGSWTTIGATGSMFSVGASWVMGLPPDNSAVYRYNGSTWSVIGGAAAAVYSGAFDLATDYNGYPYEYLSASNTWTVVGLPGDQIAVGDTWAAGITLSHSDIFIFTGAGSSWIDTHQAGYDLFIGGHMSLAARTPNPFAPGVFASAMTTTSSGGGLVLNGWVTQNAAGNNAYALYGSSTTPLAMLTATQTSVWADTVPIESPPASWSQIGNAYTRIVGGGANLYATGSIQY